MNLKTPLQKSSGVFNLVDISRESFSDSSPTQRGKSITHEAFRREPN